MMTTRTRRLLALGAVTAAVAAATPVPAAGAAPLPFTDRNAAGSIGLCNRQGQPVTSGSTLDVPFAWTAVSSAPAPNGYAQGKATLVAFQPRPQVDPGEWSGSAMTGSSSFSNPAHPVVQATNGDSPMVSFVGAYPPRIDGLVELRIYYSGVNLPEYTRTYPATVIQVSGTSWKVVSGASVDCHAGTGVSGEVAELGAKLPATAQPAALAGTSAAGAPAGSGPTTTVAGARVAGSATTTAPASAGAPAAESLRPVRASSGGGLPGVAVAAIVIAAVAAAGGGGALLLRRRRVG